MKANVDLYILCMHVNTYQYVCLYVVVGQENSMSIKTMQTHFGLLCKMELDSKCSQSSFSLHISGIKDSLHGKPCNHHFVFVWKVELGSEFRYFQWIFPYMNVQCIWKCYGKSPSLCYVVVGIACHW